MRFSHFVNLSILSLLSACYTTSLCGPGAKELNLAGVYQAEGETAKFTFAKLEAPFAYVGINSESTFKKESYNACQIGDVKILELVADSGEANAPKLYGAFRINETQSGLEVYTDEFNMKKAKELYPSLVIKMPISFGGTAEVLDNATLKAQEVIGLLVSGDHIAKKVVNRVQ